MLGALRPSPPLGPGDKGWVWDAARGCVFHINSVTSSPRNQPFQCCRRTTVSPTQGRPACVPARCLAWKRRPAWASVTGFVGQVYQWHGDSRDSCEWFKGPSHGRAAQSLQVDEEGRRPPTSPGAPLPAEQAAPGQAAPLALQSPPPSWRWAPPGPQVAAGGPRGHPS
ncbi:unnamed protein product [Rangifer tarandus platyrhynchus]|uniref:Uncharacterized protein n=1 Tax=Rangifer tarandus platyrhynchus TaxID=3082113 RepID=A0AC59YKS5_RANTA